MYTNIYIYIYIYLPCQLKHIIEIKKDNTYVLTLGKFPNNQPNNSLTHS